MTVTMSEASKLTGISAHTLRYLCEERALSGVVRGERSTYRLRSDRLPTVEQIEQVLEERVRRSIEHIRAAFDRVQVELEAVGNDIAELEDDPTGPIGIDLSVFDSYTISSHSTLRQALGRLTEAKMQLHVDSDMLRELLPNH